MPKSFIVEVNQTGWLQGRQLDGSCENIFDALGVVQVLIEQVVIKERYSLAETLEQIEVELYASLSEVLTELLINWRGTFVNRRDQWLPQSHHVGERAELNSM